MHGMPYEIDTNKHCMTINIWSSRKTPTMLNWINFRLHDAATIDQPTKTRLHAPAAASFHSFPFGCYGSTIRRPRDRRQDLRSWENVVTNRHSHKHVHDHTNKHTFKHTNEHAHTCVEHTNEHTNEHTHEHPNEHINEHTSEHTNEHTRPHKRSPKRTHTDGGLTDAFVLIIRYTRSVDIPLVVKPLHAGPSCKPDPYEYYTLLNNPETVDGSEQNNPQHPSYYHLNYSFIDRYFHIKCSSADRAPPYM